MMKEAAETAVERLDDAHRDELTGIANRRYFGKRLSESLARCDGAQ